ncbi:MAG: hypothetical protein IJM34_08325 [Lachnospiraceae bacterium]|nr:hypothetical protein [Lachnospiraceae bacterium]
MFITTKENKSTAKAASRGYHAVPVVKLWAVFFLCALFLTGCGPVACDFCGKTKFCKTFDIVGVERHICNECLNDPSVAVSGNMVRTYSERYEDGSLKYPDDSPLNPDYGKPKEEPSLTPAVMPPASGEINVSRYEQGTAGPTPTPVTAPTPTAASASSNTASDPGKLSGEALISALNSKLSADNMSLSPVAGKTGEYTLLSSGNDTHIRFKTSAGSADKDKLIVEQRENASSSDYVKAAIRSILAYTGSDDYDGLGHDVYNAAIQNGSFINNGITFVSTVHTADEIEKGAAISDFSIVP